jgi:uncharacterized protein YeaO (DUF488 family)
MGSYATAAQVDDSPLCSQVFLRVPLEGGCIRWHSLSAGNTERSRITKHGTSPFEEHVLPVRHLRLAPELARRLRTAAVSEELYDDTYTILVMRNWPASLAKDAVHAWWPLLAPLPRVLHAPRRARDNRGTSWEQFAARYRADLDALPLRLQNAYVLTLGKLLQRFPSVTLLSRESSRGLPEGQAHTQRRVVWQWLVE